MTMASCYFCWFLGIAGEDPCGCKNGVCILLDGVETCSCKTGFKGMPDSVCYSVYIVSIVWLSSNKIVVQNSSYESKSFRK